MYKKKTYVKHRQEKRGKKKTKKLNMQDEDRSQISFSMKNRNTHKKWLHVQTQKLNTDKQERCLTTIKII